MQATKMKISDAACEDSIQQNLNQQAVKKERIEMVLPFVGFVFLIVFFTFMTKGRFIGNENLQLLLKQCFTMVIVMAGAIFLYTMGSLDMAVGAVMSVSALVLSVLYLNNVPLLVSLLAGTLLSVFFMVIVAIAKNYLHIDPFIASLCVMNICTGIVSMSAKKTRVVFPYSKATWLNEASTKIVVLVVVLAVGYILFNYTAFGKSLKAIGGNPKVARASGIRVNKVTILAYVVAGIAFGIASLFDVVRGGIADISVGGGMNLNVLVGLVLGGFPLQGGSRSRFSAPIIGALMITALTNGLALMGQANTLGYAIRGILLIVVVYLSYDKSGKLTT